MVIKKRALQSIYYPFACPPISFKNCTHTLASTPNSLQLTNSGAEVPSLEKNVQEFTTSLSHDIMECPRQGEKMSIAALLN